jgi:hypothetical protein
MKLHCECLNHFSLDPAIVLPLRRVVALKPPSSRGGGANIGTKTPSEKWTDFDFIVADGA